MVKSESLIGLGIGLGMGHVQRSGRAGLKHLCHAADVVGVGMGGDRIVKTAVSPARGSGERIVSAACGSGINQHGLPRPGAPESRRLPGPHQRKPSMYH